MDLTDLIGSHDVFGDIKASCKKSLLKELAAKASKKTGIDGDTVFATLLEREKLGSTGIGNGVAIPHGKIPTLEKTVGIVAKLPMAVDYEAMDDQPVDIVFLLLVPEEAGADHLKTLARVARTLKQSNMLEQLRDADDNSAIYELLSSTKTPHAA